MNTKHKQGMRLWNIGGKLIAKGKALIDQGYVNKGRMLVAEGVNIENEGAELMAAAR